MLFAGFADGRTPDWYFGLYACCCLVFPLGLLILAVGFSIYENRRRTKNKNLKS